MDIDIRVLSATKRDPEEAVADGVLREDLYFRLNVIPIHLPPLRERSEDIPLLVEHFLSSSSASMGKAKAIHPRALEILQNYAWPGNVRELQNLIQRLSIMADGDEIGKDDIPENFHGALKPNTISEWITALPFKEAKGRYVQTFEKTYLEQVLGRYHGNISRAAKASGVNRKTFHRLISKHGLARTAGLSAA